MNRDDLVEEVRYGRMTPDEAEAEAARLGLGKLSQEPDEGTFDPMGEICAISSRAVSRNIPGTSTRMKCPTIRQLNEARTRT